MNHNNPGASRLAGLMQKQIQGSISANSSLPLEFGEIQDDFSLLTNSFPIPIPKKDYLVCRGLLQGMVGTVWTETDTSGSHYHSGGGHSHDGGSHSHSVLIAENSRSITPGDRVLVAWIGNDAVVIDIVAPLK